MSEPTTHTLDVPGSVLTYDIRSNDSSTEPILLLIGSPMGASGFGTLAGYFADRTIVTMILAAWSEADGPTTPPCPRPRSTATTCTG